MRRKRWTVTYIDKLDGQQKTRQALAYDTEYLRHWYERRGRTVISIEKTPNRKHGGVPSTSRRFTIDQSALAEAIDFLGIRQPVIIHQNARFGGVHGNHRFRHHTHATAKDRREINGASTYHRIMIKSYLSPEEGSRTLWHELAHAMQAEREAGDDVAAYSGVISWSKADLRSRKYRYKIRPCEIEAREHEALHETNPLTIPIITG